MLASDFSSSVKLRRGYELVHGYRSVSDPLVVWMLAPDLRSSVKQWCGYELVHGYRILSVSNPLVVIINPRRSLTLELKSDASIQTTSWSLTELYPWTNSYPNHCLTLDLKPDFRSSVKQWCGYELVHGYRYLSDPLVVWMLVPALRSSVKQWCGYELTGSEVRCYNYDKWITNR
jgi:hypothetical protein